MNDSCAEGKQYNNAVFSLLRTWLSYFTPDVKRRWNVLDEVKRSAKSKLSRYVRDPPTELEVDWDEKVIRTSNDKKAKVELTDWKIDPSMGIIIGNCDIPCMDYENDEGRIIILNIVGCMVKVATSETEIVVWYRRYKDITKYIMPTSDVIWNTRDSINLPDIPDEATQSIKKKVDVSKHNLSRFISTPEGGLIRIFIPKKDRVPLEEPDFGEFLIVQLLMVLSHVVGDSSSTVSTM